MKPDRPDEGSADRELFEMIEQTFPLVAEPEQQAMVQQLRSGLPSIPLRERQALIDRIQAAIGENLEWSDLEL